MDRVYSILDDFYLPQINTPGIREYQRLAKNLPVWLGRKKHDIVTDLKGNRICRPIDYDLGRFSGHSEARSHACEIINFHLKNKLRRFREDGLNPNVMVALGGANELSYNLQFMYKDHEGKPLEQGSITLTKLIDPITKKLTGFEFKDAHPRSTFKPEKMRVLIIEDFVFTGLSIKLAKEYLESLGANLIGVVSMFNSFGHEWPFDVPLNMTLLNLPFDKYPEGTCPKCISKKNKR